MEMEFKFGDDFNFTFSMGGGMSPEPVLPIVECTQEDYNAMQTHDSNTLYAIPEVTD